MLSLNTIEPAAAKQKDTIKAQSLPVKVASPKATTSKVETSSKDDKKPEEQLNSGEIHIKEALEEMKTFDMGDKDSTIKNKEAPKQNDTKLGSPFKAPAPPV